MGLMVVICPCIWCKRIKTFNPQRCPSLVVNGKREPVCADCVNEISAVRIKHGLEPYPPPLPDAYEGCDESEIDFDD